MRLVFVHGMRQENRQAKELLSDWRNALYGTWERLELAFPPVEPEMPYYGDTLDHLTREARHGGGGVSRGSDEVPFSPAEVELLREYAYSKGISDADIRTELGVEAVNRGVFNWESAQAIGRLLDRRIPLFRNIGLSLVSQVGCFLTKPHIRQAVDDIVAPYFESGPMVVVSHSLGTIVSYLLLRQSDAPSVPLFVTLGSPLGMNTVKTRIMPPKIVRPKQVGRWLNGTDNRDFVALYEKLDKDTFCNGIDNIIDIHNGDEDPHSIVDYLSDVRIAKAIHGGLST
ncbi:hypothetical protein AB4076_00255 [Dyella sp. 2RAF44]|uniref:hypothetical protein n=1 Tax=Dyella sp. 2RAF44 TaxID=3233000 RepID=UPI003F8DB5EF